MTDVFASVLEIIGPLSFYMMLSRLRRILPEAQTFILMLSASN